jgi:hypothetical protein
MLESDIDFIFQHFPKLEAMYCCSVRICLLLTAWLGLVTEIKTALIGQWVGARIPIEALVERLGCGVHGECVVRAWVGGSSRTCEPRGYLLLNKFNWIHFQHSRRYRVPTRQDLGPLLVNTPRAKHRQGLRLVTFVIVRHVFRC